MKNDKGQLLGKRKQKRFLAKHFNLGLTLEEVDNMSNVLLKSLKEDYKNGRFREE